jgi:hypothetical protein
LNLGHLPRKGEYFVREKEKRRRTRNSAEWLNLVVFADTAKWLILVVFADKTFIYVNVRYTSPALARGGQSLQMTVNRDSRGPSKTPRLLPIT